MSFTYDVLFLNRKTVEEIALPMKKIVEVVEDALIEKAHGRVQMPAKHWMERDPNRWFGGMSSIVPKTGYAAMKWQSGSDENYERGLPYITGMLFLNSLKGGTVDAIMDSTWITQQRTAAASAVAVKHLANPNEIAYSQLGCGVQARSHFEALRLVMPALKTLHVYDTNPDAAERFAASVRSEGFEAVVQTSPRAAVEASNVLITAGPIAPDTGREIASDWLHPGHTAVAIDYDCYFKPEALSSADVLATDDFGQIEHIKEYGYFVGSRTPDIEIGSIAAGLVPGRKSPNDRVIVANMGVSVEDVATAKEIYEIAKQRNIGQRLEA